MGLYMALVIEICPFTLSLRSYMVFVLPDSSTTCHTFLLLAQHISAIIAFTLLLKQTKFINALDHFHVLTHLPGMFFSYVFHGCLLDIRITNCTAFHERQISWLLSQSCKFQFQHPLLFFSSHHIKCFLI